MTTRPIRITPATRHMCVESVITAPNDWLFTPPSEPTRNLSQNARFHALIADIAKQHEFFGKKRDEDTVKRLLVDAFARVKENLGEPLASHGQMLPSLVDDGYVQLGIQTRRFSKKLMTELIEYVTAWAVENGVRLTDAKTEIPGWYQDREVA